MVPAEQEGKTVDEDDVLEATLEAGADDVHDLGEAFEVVSEATDLVAVRTALQAAGIDYDSAEASFVPDNKVELDKDGAAKLFRLIDALEDLDDVQNLFANYDVSDAIIDRARGRLTVPWLRRSARLRRGGPPAAAGVGGGCFVGGGLARPTGGGGAGCLVVWGPAPQGRLRQLGCRVAPTTSGGRVGLCAPRHPLRLARRRPCGSGPRAGSHPEAGRSRRPRGPSSPPGGVGWVRSIPVGRPQDFYLHTRPSVEGDLVGR